jgi:hypothetical protein
MRSVLSRTVFVLMLISVLTVCWNLETLSVYSQSGPPCPGQVCGLTSRCGGQLGSFGSPPGPMSMCSVGNDGDSCEYCTGTTVVNVCISGGTGGTKCKFGEPVTCGSPMKGVCKKKTALGTTFYYCERTSGRGTSSCKYTPCNGEVPCQ